MFLQPRRFPEYLRLQNIRDRGVDIAELSPASVKAGTTPAESPSEAARDNTLARIGEVLPAEGVSQSGPACACDSGVPRLVHSGFDGLGRMIDVVA